MEREGKEIRARDRKVLKHTKEGLVEQNLTKNKIRNISGKIKDVNLEKTLEERKKKFIDLSNVGRPTAVKRKKPQIFIRDMTNNLTYDENINLNTKEYKVDAENVTPEFNEEPDNINSNINNEIIDDREIDKNPIIKEKINHKKQYKIFHKGRYKEKETSSKQDLIFNREDLDISKDTIEEKLNQQERYRGNIEDLPIIDKDTYIENNDIDEIFINKQENPIIKDKTNKEKDKKKRREKTDHDNRTDSSSKLKHERKKKNKYFHQEQDKENSIKDSVSNAISTVGLIGAGTNKLYHNKMEEVEDENVGTEASHKAQKIGEKLVGKTSNYRTRRKNRRFKKEDKEFIKADKLRDKLEFNQVLKQDKDYKDLKRINKHIQKWKLKREYSKKSRKTISQKIIGAIKGSPEFIKGIGKKTGKKAGAYIITLAFLMFIIMVSIQSCSNILMGGMGTITGTSYQASDIDVTEADVEYTRLETGLLLTLQDIEVDNPGYDEYRYNLDGVGHDPHELLAYLTAKYGDFKISHIKGELQRIFKEQYKLTFQEFTETYTVTETFTDPETGESYEIDVEYEKVILLTTLISRPLNEVLLEELDKDDKELYDVLMISKGNFMSYNSPVDGDWKQYISSLFGWRVHPIHMIENFHTGLDIANPEGEPLYAIFGGMVREVGYDANGYGHYIIIQDKRGNTALYAHCSSIVSSQGSEIKTGDIIARVGSTGTSTGSHLHLELKDSEGNLLNPYFYLYSEAGSSIGTGIYYNGYRGNYGNPGIAYDDEDLMALFNEADKHLGKRYVFGANGPTNFDCSSFVCWVFRNSGIYNIPRTTAQGIFNQSTSISPTEARPGDIIFFTGTYNAGVPVTHVGIYAGNGMMVHAGDPIQYTSIESNYWRSHFYSFGRLR